MLGFTLSKNRYYIRSKPYGKEKMVWKAWREGPIYMWNETELAVGRSGHVTARGVDAWRLGGRIIEITSIDRSPQLMLGVDDLRMALCAVFCLASSKKDSVPRKGLPCAFAVM